MSHSRPGADQSEQRSAPDPHRSRAPAEGPDAASDDGSAQTESRPTGLTAGEAAARLAEVGPNEIAEERRSAWLRLLGYFWGPIPWMIEVAALLSAVLRHWADLAIIGTLLVFNAGVGFWQERQAGNAIEQLRRRLALRARVLRDGTWGDLPARELVPGDVVRLRLGDVIPADARLFEGDYLSVDQSALTGESLPVEARVGAQVYSGSVVKQGEMTGVVTATGMQTYFGHTARLVGEAGSVSHFQKAVLQIGDYLIYVTLALVAVLLLVEIQRAEPLLQLIRFALVLTVAAIPVALPAVLSVTMAVGAVALSRMKAIVARLESIEEMAGIDVLCSDKTGTLTENQLTLGNPALFADLEPRELVLFAALASRSEDRDAIDAAVLGGLDDPASLSRWSRLQFVPFDPVRKHSEAVVEGPGGARWHVAKGAPQVILALCRPDAGLSERATARIDALAGEGYRTLGVARSTDGEGWQFLGLLPLYDPPREDAAETLAQAARHGVSVKMVTGDNLAIARQIAARLGLGSRIRDAEALAVTGDREELSAAAAQEVEEADGFAQVFPEHKYAIVRALQGRGHLVGMTGDGVNDAPALKQADVGIAVTGATDAARAAADLVLTAPGLSVLVRAVEEARRIFERMNSYAIYRITETLRIMIFMVLAMIVYDLYPITAIMIILLALLNDLPIMTIAYDRTWLDPRPVRWEMRRVLTVASVLGAIGVAETFLLLVVARSWFHVGLEQLQSLIFLKLAVAGHLTLFVARSQRPMVARPRPAPILLAAILGTQALAAAVVGFGWLVAPIPWTWVGGVWVYCLVWVAVEDAAKLGVYRHLRLQAGHHRGFLRMLKQPLHHHPTAGPP